jgi:uncharacterized protein DUF1236
MFALALFGAAAAFNVHVAWAQNAGASPGGAVPGPNATQPQAPDGLAGRKDVQPVPGAMPGSDAVPSTLSAKNAADDKLPTLAYTFKQLTDDQRRAIYQMIKEKAANAAPPGAATTAAEVSTTLPTSVPLSAMPSEVTAQVPQTSGYEYAIAGDKVLLVSPANRAVVGVITQ